MFSIYFCQLLGNTEAEEVHKTVSVTSSVLNHQPLDQHGLLIIFCEIAHSDGSDKVIEKAKIGIETGTMYIVYYMCNMIIQSCTVHVYTCQ